VPHQALQRTLPTIVTFVDPFRVAHCDNAIVKRSTLRVLQVLFGTVGGLLVVPYAVNLDTGGTAPGWLRPHIGWWWPVALACVAAIIGL